jgi:hypothetical protein
VDIFTIILNHRQVEISQTFNLGILACGDSLALKKYSLYCSEVMALTKNRTNNVIISWWLCTGMKASGGFFLLDWFCVNSSSPDLSIGMWQIWRFKTDHCIVTILTGSGSHNFSCHKMVFPH